MKDFISPESISLVFALFMGISLFIYAVLDGYDLGVGVLSFFLDEEEKDPAIDSIGPFWDANETWLVLSVGILLVAFPKAHGEILGNVYLPVSFMLLGLILRGVAYDFRKKVHASGKSFWTALFAWGSLVAAISQGFMLGLYLSSFRKDLSSQLFASFTAIALLLVYVSMGSNWLLMKSPQQHFEKILDLAKRSLFLCAFSILVVAVSKPFFITRALNPLDSVESILVLAPYPMMTALLITIIFLIYYTKTFRHSGLVWLPFVLMVTVMALLSHGIVMSLFPYVIPGQLTLRESVASVESLLIILAGAGIVLPIQMIYTIFIYRIFHGRVKIQ